MLPTKRNITPILKQQNFSLKLKWSEGHLWKLTLPVVPADMAAALEYKFVIKEGQRVVRWEEGKNHVLNYPDVMRQVTDALKV